MQYEPSREVAVIDDERTYVGSKRGDFDWPIAAEGRKNAAVNPVVATSTQSPSQTAGCSNLVTPIPLYIPRLAALDWIIGVLGFVQALLDPDGRARARSETIVSTVEERLDLNDFLPTTYDDMAEWRTVVGSTARPART